MAFSAPAAYQMLMERADRIARKDAAYLLRGAVEKHHRLAAEPAGDERLDAPDLGVVDHSPEADAAESAPHRAADERQRLVPLWLEDRKTVLRHDSDVGFQHAPQIPRAPA